MTPQGPGETLFAFVRHWSRRDPGSSPTSVQQGRVVMIIEAVYALEQRCVPPIINAVADEIGIDQSGASRLVRSAVGAGYLILRPSEDDARRRQATVTPAGHELLVQAHLWQEKVFDELTRGWSKKRREEFQWSMMELMDRSVNQNFRGA